MNLNLRYATAKPGGASSIGAWSALQMGLKSELIEPLTIWKNSANNKHLTGQFFSEKVLHNGNIQKRITTAFGDGYLGMETAIYSPSGELLNAYAGIRENYTRMYASGKTKNDVIEVVDKMVAQDRNAKSLLR